MIDDGLAAFTTPFSIFFNESVGIATVCYFNFDTCAPIAVFKDSGKGYN